MQPFAIYTQFIFGIGSALCRSLSCFIYRPFNFWAFKLSTVKASCQLDQGTRSSPHRKKQYFMFCGRYESQHFQVHTHTYIYTRECNLKSICSHMIDRTYVLTFLMLLQTTKQCLNSHGYPNDREHAHACMQCYNQTACRLFYSIYTSTKNIITGRCPFKMFLSVCQIQQKD